LKALKREDKVAMRSAKKNIMQVFMQEPFDKVAYQQAVQGLNKLHQAQMATRVNLMSDMAQYLSPAERKLLVGLIMKRGGRK
jgi:phosphoenolpyruvate synthase/pyruvate phosphate dikinase